MLLTGFEPFAGDQTNPSGDAVVRLGAAWNGPARLVTAVLPVDFARAGAELIELVATHRPDVVIATGLAGGRDAITPERIAVNLRDARIPDNAGHQPETPENSQSASPCGACRACGARVCCVEQRLRVHTLRPGLDTCQSNP